MKRRLSSLISASLHPLPQTPFQIWEKESIHRPAPVQNFSLQEKMGSTEERFRWWIYGFPGFCRVFVSTAGLESFSLRPEKFSKRFSFGGGCVRLSLLCKCHLGAPNKAFLKVGSSLTSSCLPRIGHPLSSSIIRGLLLLERPSWVGFQVLC